MRNRLLNLVVCGTLCTLLGAAALAQPPAKSPIRSLQGFVDRHALAGAVTLVATKNKILSVETLGYADVAANKPMQAGSLFWIASQSKPMTVAVLMMLVDEGKVKVDDPVEKYLPEFTGQMLAVEQDQDHVLLKKPPRPIAVRDILSHTSGLPFMSRIEQRTGKIDLLTLREAVISYAMTPLQTPPGRHYQYSNAGINTAGRIVEVVSGMPYETFMEQRLFAPLGMKDTTFWPTAEQVGRLAKCYKPNQDKRGLTETPISHLSYPLTDRRRTPCPAGGLFSTAADVCRFCRMVLSGGDFEGRHYLSRQAVAQMTALQTGDAIKNPNDNGYGFGWQVYRRPRTALEPMGLGTFGHGGACATNMWIDPQDGLITVYMVQQQGGYAAKDGNKILPAFVRAALDAFAK